MLAVGGNDGTIAQQRRRVVVLVAIHLRMADHGLDAANLACQ